MGSLAIEGKSHHSRRLLRVWKTQAPGPIRMRSGEQGRSIYLAHAPAAQGAQTPAPLTRAGDTHPSHTRGAVGRRRLPAQPGVSSSCPPCRSQHHSPLRGSLTCSDTTSLRPQASQVPCPLCPATGPPWPWSLLCHTEENKGGEWGDPLQTQGGVLQRERAARSAGPATAQRVPAQERVRVLTQERASVRRQRPALKSHSRRTPRAFRQGGFSWSSPPSRFWEGPTP